MQSILALQGAATAAGLVLRQQPGEALDSMEEAERQVAPPPGRP